MFVARVVFFRLHESPRYLVHAGRPHEAVLSLRKISEFNGEDMTIGLGDVEDRRGSVLFSAEDRDVEAGGSVHHTSDLPFDEPESIFPAPTLNQPTNTKLYYHSTADASPSPRNSVAYEGGLPGSSRMDAIDDPGETETDPLFSVPEPKTATLSKPPARPRPTSSASQISLKRVKFKFLLRLPPWARRPLSAWLNRLAMVLSKEWRYTTLLVWWIWFAISLG
jgi:hypothetical protein